MPDRIGSPIQGRGSPDPLFPYKDFEESFPHSVRGFTRASHVPLGESGRFLSVATFWEGSRTIGDRGTLPVGSGVLFGDFPAWGDDQGA